MITATAPGKLILCGEHAVVYAQPAIALPVHSIGATVSVSGITEPEIRFSAPDLGEAWSLTNRPDHPLSHLARRTLERLGIAPAGLELGLRSTIPIASGMGSGAALGAALVRALAAQANQPLGPAEVSALVYECECFYHGTPSGIDNTVVSFEQAIWFQRHEEQPTLTPLTIGAPLMLVVGDTGVRAPTKATVGGVRQRWLIDPEHYNRLFAEIGSLVQTIRDHLALGQIGALGPLLDHNQTLLASIGVSSPELETLITAARNAGALGAKLSGGGGGGVMLALVEPSQAAVVAAALTEAGAAQVLTTVLPASTGAGLAGSSTS